MIDGLFHAHFRHLRQRIPVSCRKRHLAHPLRKCIVQLCPGGAAGDVGADRVRLGFQQILHKVPGGQVVRYVPGQDDKFYSSISLT